MNHRNDPPLFPRLATFSKKSWLALALLAVSFPFDSMGNPEILVPAGPGNSWGLVNGDKHKQSAKPLKQEDRSWVQLEWSPGAGGFAEMFSNGKPFLKAYREGIKLEITVDKTQAPQLTSWGVRALDANGETWHFGGTLPEGGGIVTGSLVLDSSLTGNNHYGGSDEGKGTIDLPLRLSTLMFNLPNKPAESASILIGDLMRNAVDVTKIEPEIPIMAVTASVVTDGPLNLISNSKRAESALVLKNAASATPVTVHVDMDFRAFDGTTVTETKENIALPPGGEVRLPLGNNLSKLGWWQLTPTIRTPGGTGKITMKPIMLGVINPAGQRAKPPADGFWFGLDARFAPHNYNRLADSCAMIGADIIRNGVTWADTAAQGPTPDWKQHDLYLKALNDRGLYAQYGLGFTPKWAAKQEHIDRIKAEKLPEWTIAMTPPKIDAWRNYSRLAMQHIKEQGFKIEFIEIWNEPDLYGFWRGTTEEYLETYRVASEEIRKVDPSLKIMTGGFAIASGAHGGQSNNPDLIHRSVLDDQKAYDVVNIHEHGSFGEGYQTRMDNAWGPLMAKLSPPKPFYHNETGAAVSQEDRQKQAGELYKKFAFARARGAVGFNWFCLNFPSEYHYSMISNDDQPYPVLPAYNAMVNLMRGFTRPVQLEAARGNWMFGFAGNGGHLFIGWDENSPVVDTTVPAIVPEGAKAEFVDLYGNLSPAKVEHGVVLWALKKEVASLRLSGVKEGTAPQVAPPLIVFGTEPYGEPGRKVMVEATVSNPLTVPAVVALTWTGHDGVASAQKLQLAAKESKRIELAQIMPPAAAGKTPAVGLAYSFEGLAGWSGRQNLPMHAARLLPKGGIADREADFVLETKEHIFNNNQADPTRAQWTWQGPSDISSRAWFAIEPGDKALLVRIDVRDEKHMQPNDQPSVMWKGDSVQLGLVIPGRGGAWELGLARNDDGKTMVNSWRNPEGTARDYANKIELKVTPIDGGLSYKARLPFEGAGFDAAFLRTAAVGLNFIVNDEDGGGREGWVFLADGLGQSTEPEKWPLFSFE